MALCMCTHGKMWIVFKMNNPPVKREKKRALSKKRRSSNSFSPPKPCPGRNRISLVRIIQMIQENNQMDKTPYLLGVFKKKI